MHSMPHPLAEGSDTPPEPGVLVRAAEMLDAVIQPLVLAFKIGVCICLTGIVVVASAQVVLRFALNSSLFWSEELIRFAFTWSILLSAAIGLEMKAHFSVDVLSRFLPETGRRLLSILCQVVILAVSGYFIIYGIRFTTDNWIQASDTMRIPMALVYVSIPIAAVVMCLVSIREILKLAGGAALEVRSVETEVLE